MAILCLQLHNTKTAIVTPFEWTQLITGTVFAFISTVNKASICAKKYILCYIYATNEALLQA